MLDLADVTDWHKRDVKTPEPLPLDHPPVGAHEDAKGDEAPADQAKSGGAPEEGAPEEQPDPEHPSAEDKNSPVHFPLLRFTEAARARLDSVGPKRFAAMVSHAERRISP